MQLMLLPEFIPPHKHGICEECPHEEHCRSIEGVPSSLLVCEKSDEEVGIDQTRQPYDTWLAELHNKLREEYNYYAEF